jgi:CBS domain-containing protein
MSQKQIRRLPVMDGQNRPMGVISMNDIARAAASHRNSATDHQVVKTIAAICEPRPLTKTKRMMQPEMQAAV